MKSPICSFRAKREAAGEIVVHTRKADFVIEFSMTATLDETMPGGWLLDNPTPQHVVFVRRDGRTCIKPIRRWFDQASRRETYLYVALCRILDDYGFADLCDRAEVEEGD